MLESFPYIAQYSVHHLGETMLALTEEGLNHEQILRVATRQPQVFTRSLAGAPPRHSPSCRLRAARAHSVGVCSTRVAHMHACVQLTAHSSSSVVYVIFASFFCPRSPYQSYATMVRMCSGRLTAESCGNMYCSNWMHVECTAVTATRSRADLREVFGELKAYGLRDELPYIAHYCCSILATSSSSDFTPTIEFLRSTFQLDEAGVTSMLQAVPRLLLPRSLARVTQTLSTLRSCAPCSRTTLHKPWRAVKVSAHGSVPIDAPSLCRHAGNRCMYSLAKSCPLVNTIRAPLFLHMHVAACPVRLRAHIKHR